jgi:hypothetical protein
LDTSLALWRNGLSSLGACSQSGVNLGTQTKTP